jgi:hypothetical protein
VAAVVVTVGVAVVAAVVTVGVTVAVIGVEGIVGVVLTGTVVPSDGFTANATSNIVVVSTEIKVSDVITQLHIWQSPVVKQSMLYIHNITSGTVISVYNK